MATSRTSATSQSFCSSSLALVQASSSKQKQVRDKTARKELGRHDSDYIPRFSLRRASSVLTLSASSWQLLASILATLASSLATRLMVALPSASSWAACLDSSTRA